MTTNCKRINKNAKKKSWRLIISNFYGLCYTRIELEKYREGEKEREKDGDVIVYCVSFVKLSERDL